MIKEIKNSLKEKLVLKNNAIWFCVNIGIATLLIYSTKNKTEYCYTTILKIEAPWVRIGLEIKEIFF